MFKYRIVSFVGLLAAFGAMIFWKPYGEYIAVVAALVLLVLLSLECGALFDRIGFKSDRATTAVWTLLPAAAAILGGMPNRTGILLSILLFVFCMVWMLGGWFLILFCREKGEILKRFAGSIGIGLLAGTPFMSYCFIYEMSPLYLLYLVLVTKSMDTGGYIFGMLSSRLPGGNHKIVPSISPKKSWEGTAGGMMLSMLTAFILMKCGVEPFPVMINLCVAAPLLALGSFAGDLTESALKRAAGVKDSGAVIPGMGGVFDVLDSFIYNGWIFFAIMLACRTQAAQ